MRTHSIIPLPFPQYRFFQRACRFVQVPAVTGALLFGNVTIQQAADYTTKIDWRGGGNTSPIKFSVNLHFSESPQTRTVEVLAVDEKGQTGNYVFQDEFTYVGQVPSDLTVRNMQGAAGQTSRQLDFEWQGAKDKQVTVTLFNTLVPKGGGGGGPPPKMPFELAALLRFLYCSYETVDGQTLTNLVMFAETKTNLVARIFMGLNTPIQTGRVQMAVPGLCSVSPTGVVDLQGGKRTFELTAKKNAGGPQNIVVSSPKVTLPAPIEPLESKMNNTAIGACSTNLPLFVSDVKITAENYTIIPHGNGRVDDLGDFFVLGHRGIVANAKARIQVLPDTLSPQMKDEEAAKWQVGWFQNITSLGRTVYYQTDYYYCAFTDHDVPHLDVALNAQDPLFVAPPNAPPITIKHFTKDNDLVAMDQFYDWPTMKRSWFSGFANGAQKALMRDQYRLWIAGRRVTDAPAIYQEKNYRFANYVNWSTDHKATFDPYRALNQRVLTSTFNSSAGNAHGGSGGGQLDMEPPGANDVSVWRPEPIRKQN